jgi:hypothetical protein
MATQSKRSVQSQAGLQKPAKLDLEKGMERALKLVRENEEWVKEMAKK